MKKKILGITISLIALLALSVGGIMLLRNSGTEETKIANRLDVSWYDVQAEEITISTVEQLYELAALSEYYTFEEQTIKLDADLVINEGDAKEWLDKAPKKVWTPITGFSGTFDGQGHTISGLYAKGYNTPVALFINTKSSCEIKNLKLVNSCFDTAGFDGGTASIASNGGGKFRRLYSNAIINCEGNDCGGIISNATAQSTIEECWYDGVITLTGRNAGGIVDAVLGQRTTISHCLFTGEITTPWIYNGSRVGGLCGMTNNVGTALVISDSLSVGSVVSEGNAYYSASIIGAVHDNNTFMSIDTFASTYTSDNLIGKGSTGKVEGSPIEIYGENLVGAGGYAWTTLDFENYWSVTSDSTPVLKCFATEATSVDGLEKAFDTSWYSDQQMTQVISDAKQLYGLTFLSATNDFSGMIIQLGADIVMNEGDASKWGEEAPENAWYPIKKFAGIFDGQGYTISGIYVNGEKEISGLFKETTSTSVIKNLKLTNSYFYNGSTKNAIMGSISGRGNGTYDTIYSDAIVVGKGAVLGGLIGQINNAKENKITNCWFDGSVKALEQTGRYTGGIVANIVKGTTTIEHCLNSGTISSERTGAAVYAGGLVSAVMNEGTVLNIIDSLNVGKIVTKHDVCVGAVVGRHMTDSVLTIADTYATSESYQHPKNGFMGIGNQSLGTHNGEVVSFSEQILVGVGGYQYTSLDFAKYWSARSKMTPALKSFVGNGTGVGKVWRIDTSWYKDSKKTFTISNISQLYGFAVLVNSGTDFEGKTVYLGADIVVNDGNAGEWAKGQKLPKNVWTPIGSKTAPFKGTFDGQSHIIQGIYANVGNAQYAGLFGYAVNTTIKNLKLQNSFFASEAEKADMGSILGYGDGALENIYSDAILSATGIRTGGIIGVPEDKATGGEPKVSENTKLVMRNCWFDGTISLSYPSAKAAYTGGLIAYQMYGVATLEHVLNTGTIHYRNSGEKNDKAVSAYIGGIIARTNTGVVIHISDSLSAGSCVIENAKLSNVRSLTGRTADDIHATDTVYATNLFAATTGVASVSPTQHTTIEGINGYRRTDLDFVTYWGARKDAVPALKHFMAGTDMISLEGVDKAIVPDTGWVVDGAGTKENPYKILDAGDLYGLAQLVNEGTTFEGKYIELVNDIYINKNWDASSQVVPDDLWTPIGKSKKQSFQGVFDGNFKTISGLYTDSDASAVGLFGFTVNSTIKDLYIKNSKFIGRATPSQVGSVIGYGDGLIDKVYSDAYLVGYSYRVGGLVGCVQDAKDEVSSTKLTIVNSWYAGSITQECSSNMYSGGLIGAVVYGPVSIENSIYSGSLSAAYTGTAKTYEAMSGGLIGGCGTKNIQILIENTEILGSVAVTSPNKVIGVGTVIGRYRVGTNLGLNKVYTVKEYTYDIAGVVENGATAPTATVTMLADSTVELLNEEVVSNNRQLTNMEWISWTKQNEIPVLVFAETTPVEERIDMTWYTEAAAGVGESADKPYVISDLADLYGMANLVNTGETNFKGKFIRLEKDIVVNAGWTASAVAPENCKEWTPIGKSKSINFQGTFDGNGKSISGIYLRSSGYQMIGLFGCTKDCVIKNLKLENSYIEQYGTGSSKYIGGIVGYGSGTFDRIYSDAIIVNYGIQAGGIIGRVQDGTKATELTNCWYAGNITMKNTSIHAGGIVGGLITQNLTISNCLNTGDITCEKTGEGLYVGGIIGSVNNKNLAVAVNNCVNSGEINAEVGTKRYVGAVYGGTTKAITFTVSNTYYMADSCEVATGVTLTGENTIKAITDMSTTISALNNLASNEKWAEWKQELGKILLELWSDR